MGTNIIRCQLLDSGGYHGNITAKDWQIYFIFGLNSLIFIVSFHEFFLFFATLWK